MNYIFDEDFARRYATVTTGTGSGASTVTPNGTLTLKFDQYEIVLAVTEDNRVLGVIEVRQKKDFRDVKQKIASTGYIDMERFATE
jgi:hypothetical protein